MLLLLQLLLLLRYVSIHVLVRGRGATRYNYVVNSKYIPQKQQQLQQQQHLCLTVMLHPNGESE